MAAPACQERLERAVDHYGADLDEEEMEDEEELEEEHQDLERGDRMDEEDDDPMATSASDPAPARLGRDLGRVRATPPAARRRKYLAAPLKTHARSSLNPGSSALDEEDEE